MVEMYRNRAEAGLEYITEALWLRPAWPYDWLTAGHLLAMNSIFDERMTAALSRIQETGASERALQFGTAVLVLGYWYHLDEHQRQTGLVAIEAVLHRKRDARELAAIIEELQRVDLFCRRLVNLVDYGPAWCVNFKRREKARWQKARNLAQ